MWLLVGQWAIRHLDRQGWTGQHNGPGTVEIASALPLTLQLDAPYDFTTAQRSLSRKTSTGSMICGAKPGLMKKAQHMAVQAMLRRKHT